MQVFILHFCIDVSHMNVQSLCCANWSKKLHKWEKKFNH